MTRVFDLEQPGVFNLEQVAGVHYELGMKPMRVGPLLSLEKSLRRQEVCTAIGRQLREYYYNVSQPLSEGLAELVKKIEQSNYSLPLTRDDPAESQTTDRP